MRLVGVPTNSLIMFLIVLDCHFPLACAEALWGEVIMEQVEVNSEPLAFF